MPTAVRPALRQPKAMYLIRTIDDSGLQAIDYRQVAFDWQRAIDIATDLSLPYSEFYAATLRTNAYQYAPSAVAAYNGQHEMAAQARAILMKTI